MEAVKNSSIPPAAEVRKQLAAATAETRYLRRLLRIAKERDQAAQLRRDAEQSAGGNR
jgi:hypothetical protein